MIKFFYKTLLYFMGHSPEEDAMDTRTVKMLAIAAMLVLASMVNAVAATAWTPDSTKQYNVGDIATIFVSVSAEDFPEGTDWVNIALPLGGQVVDLQFQISDLDGITNAPIDSYVIRGTPDIQSVVFTDLNTGDFLLCVGFCTKVQGGVVTVYPGMLSGMDYEQGYEAGYTAGLAAGGDTTAAYNEGVADTEKFFEGNANLSIMLNSEITAVNNNHSDKSKYGAVVASWKMASGKTVYVRRWGAPVPEEDVVNGTSYCDYYVFVDRDDNLITDPVYCQIKRYINKGSGYIEYTTSEDTQTVTDAGWGIPGFTCPYVGTQKIEYWYKNANGVYILRHTTTTVYK